MKTWRENLQHCNLCKGIHQKYSTWGFCRFHCNWVENVGASRLTVCARKTLPWPCPYWGQWCRRESFQPPPAQFGQFGHRFRGVSSFLVAMVNAIWNISNLGTPFHPDWSSSLKIRVSAIFFTHVSRKHRPPTPNRIPSQEIASTPKIKPHSTRGYIPNRKGERKKQIQVSPNHPMVSKILKLGKRPPKKKVYDRISAKKMPSTWVSSILTCPRVFPPSDRTSQLIRCIDPGRQRLGAFLCMSPLLN